jgi:ribosome-associated protein
LRTVVISSDTVELFKLLKFEGLASSGGEAKMLIDAGKVKVNGDTETRKRKKLRSGDIVEFDGENMLIRTAGFI